MNYWPPADDPQPIQAPAALVRPPTRVTTAIRFPPEMHDQLKAAAEDRDLSINYLVVRAVEEFLPRLIPASEWKLTR